MASSRVSARSRYDRGPCRGPWARQTGRVANVRLPIPISAFRAHGRLSQLSANCGPQRRCSKNRLFDLLIRAQQNRCGHRKAERLRGLELHDHLKFGWKLHREIARLFAAQDAIDIGGGATPGVYQVGSVGEQAAVFNKLRSANMIGARFVTMNPSGMTTRPPPGSRPRARMAVSISAWL